MQKTEFIFYSYTLNSSGFLTAVIAKDCSNLQIDKAHLQWQIRNVELGKPTTKRWQFTIGCTVGEKNGQPNKWATLNHNFQSKALTFAKKNYETTEFQLIIICTTTDTLHQKWTKQGLPSCNGKWLLTERLLDFYDFRCDKCKLLSTFSPVIEKWIPAGNNRLCNGGAKPAKFNNSSSVQLLWIIEVFASIVPPSHKSETLSVSVKDVTHIQTHLVARHTNRALKPKELEFYANDRNKNNLHFWRLVPTNTTKMNSLAVFTKRTGSNSGFPSEGCCRTRHWHFYFWAKLKEVKEWRQRNVANLAKGIWRFRKGNTNWVYPVDYFIWTWRLRVFDWWT